MKACYRLIAWNWRVTYKAWCLVWVLTAAVETAVVLTAAGRFLFSGQPYDNIFFFSYAWVVFALGYVAALGVSLRPMLLARGKSKTTYTLATLPQGGRNTYLAQLGCTALSLLCFIAAQLALVFVLYFPATAINRAATVRAVPEFIPAMPDWQLTWVRNTLVRTLLPVTGAGALALLFAVAVPAVLVTTALFQRGAARVGVIVLGAFGAVCCAYLLAESAFGPVLRNFYTWLYYGAHAALLAILGICLALSARSIRRAQWV